MKEYIVTNKKENYSETFYTLREAKKAMKEHNAVGVIYKYWSDGTFENLGEISLTESNKTFVANTKQKDKSYQ